MQWSCVIYIYIFLLLQSLSHNVSNSTGKQGGHFVSMQYMLNWHHITVFSTAYSFIQLLVNFVVNSLFSRIYISPEHNSFPLCITYCNRKQTFSIPRPYACNFTYVTTSTFSHCFEHCQSTAISHLPFFGFFHTLITIYLPLHTCNWKSL